MTDRKRQRFEDELRQRLRRGDPAADGSEPRPDEIARMRRAVLAAAEEAPRRLVWVPALVAAAVLLVAVAGWVLVRGSRAPEPVLVESTRTVPEQDPPQVATTGTPELPESPEPVYERPETVAALDPPSRVSDSARTVRFTTAGGTRIVWVLDPNLDI